MAAGARAPESRACCTFFQTLNPGRCLEPARRRLAGKGVALGVPSVGELGWETGMPHPALWGGAPTTMSDLVEAGMLVPAGSGFSHGLAGTLPAKAGRHP